MKLTKMVDVKGYDTTEKGNLPVYLADEITEDVGGKKECKLHIAIATLSVNDKIYGEDAHIIVVDKHFLRFSKKTKLALILYYNRLLEYSMNTAAWRTQKGPEMGAKAEVVAEFGKLRFTKAFRKLEAGERRAIRRCTGGLHHQFKQQTKEIKKVQKELGDAFLDDEEERFSAVDVVAYYMEQEKRQVEISSYKGAPIDSGREIDRNHTPRQTPDLSVVYGDDVEEDEVAPAVEPAPAQA